MLSPPKITTSPRAASQAMEAPPGRGAGGRELLGPGAVVGPGVPEEAGVLPPEQHHLADGRAIGRGGALPGRGAGGRELLGPGGAVLGPGVPEEAGVLPPEQHHLADGRVIGHGGPVPHRGAGGRELLGPGGAVVGPGVVTPRTAPACRWLGRRPW